MLLGFSVTAATKPLGTPEDVKTGQSQRDAIQFSWQLWTQIPMRRIPALQVIETRRKPRNYLIQMLLLEDLLLPVSNLSKETS